MIVRNRMAMLLFSVSVLLPSCSDAKDPEPLLDEANYEVYLDTSRIDRYGDYTYEFWNQDEIGNTAMGLRADGSFEVAWDGIYNMLARNGVRPGNNVTTVSYTVEGYRANTASYLCVYGWFYNGNYDDLVEYYIVDNWKNYNPASNATYYDSVIVDGVTYRLYTSERIQQPSINGTATFTQYWSIRDEKELRTSGTIDVPAHFRAWNEAGLSIGSMMYEVSFCIEGFGGESGGSGYANVTELDFNIK